MPPFMAYRKALVIVWIVDMVALVCLLGYMRLYGSTPADERLARDLAVVFGVLGVVLLVWKKKVNPDATNKR